MSSPFTRRRTSPITQQSSTSPQPPNFQPKKILSIPWRVTLAIAGAVAVLTVIGLVASSATDTIDT
jgi:hypothetical protein